MYEVHMEIYRIGCLCPTCVGPHCETYEAHVTIILLPSVVNVCPTCDVTIGVDSGTSLEGKGVCPLILGTKENKM